MKYRHVCRVVMRANEISYLLLNQENGMVPQFQTSTASMEPRNLLDNNFQNS